MLEVALARPYWTEQEEAYHRERLKGVTILICQRRTRDLMHMCIGSLISHYPEVPILVVDGNSQDDSADYLRYVSAKHPNIKVWWREKERHSHGEMMDEAIRGHVFTPKFIILDSDTRSMRPGWIEGMMEQYNTIPMLYATGSLMYVSRSNEACGPPKDETDALPYAHPSCSMYDTESYKSMEQARFCDHGAPCVGNMIVAERQGMVVAYFPIDKYVQHLCGASWQEVSTVWDNDGNTSMRPLITFIVTKPEHFTMLLEQNDHDFNIITKGRFIRKTVGTYKRPHDLMSYYFDVRFRINGDYVVELNEDVNDMAIDFVKQVRRQLTELNCPTEYDSGGLIVYERKHWQESISFT